MPDTVTNSAPSGDGSNSGSPAAANTGTDPAKTDNAAPSSTSTDFDPTKLSDEQLNKVLEDQRLWKNERISKALEAQKELRAIKELKAKEEEQSAIKKGEFDKVLTEKDAKIKNLEEQIKGVQLDNTLRSELQKAGVTNTEAALRIIDRSGLAVGEGGKIEGLETAIEGLKRLAPELLTATNTSVGAGTNPSGANPHDGQFKMSEINDPVFYQKNHVAIQKAMASGRIIDDTAK